MSSDNWKRLQSEGTMNLLSGIACLSTLEVRRMGIVVGFDEPSAAPAADVPAWGAFSVTADIMMPVRIMQLLLLLWIALQDKKLVVAAVQGNFLLEGDRDLVRVKRQNEKHARPTLQK